MLICANVVGPTEIIYPITIQGMQDENYTFAEQFLASDGFRQKFNHIC